MTSPGSPASSRPAAEQKGDLPSRSRPLTATDVLSCTVSVLGVVIAIGAVATMEWSAASIYAVYFVLAFAFEFVWLGSRFPFALPYYTTMNAFAYLGGPPIVTLEYLQRVISYPILAYMARRGLMTLPPPLVPILGPQSKSPGALLRAWIDHGTAGTLGALSVLLRFGLYTWSRSSFELGLVPAIAIGEFGTLAILGIVHAVMPLPLAEDLRLGGRWRWRLDDERVDLIVVVILVAPLFVFVINLAYELEGLAGAAGFSLATLGPHLLMKLSNDRLGRVSGLLESKQQELKNLVYTVAHDLKSPISAALLTTDLVIDRDGPGLGAEAQQDLARVVRLLSRAEDMVRDLLRVFRIVWEPERWTEVDLDTVVGQVLETVAPKAAARGAIVSVSPLPVVWGQPSKLEHALSNLFENAVRHLPSAGGEITVDGEVEGTVVTIRVRDNGCGIPGDYLDRIFQLYSQVPQSSDSSGSGVGLSIVKRVVDAHGGRVWVDSEVGAGSCFHLQLPRVVAFAKGGGGAEPTA